MNIKIEKSSRHSKITGNFAENLVAYWLSKHDFECAIIDHVGMDIIAKNPKTNQLMGISVKCRSRNKRREGSGLNISNDNFKKLRKACKVFGCEPYFGIVVDEKNKIRFFIISMKQMLDMYSKGKTTVSWRMNEKHIAKYYQNPEIKIVEFDYDVHRWWQ